MTGSLRDETVVERLEWDTEHFGFLIGRVIGPEGPDRIRAAAEVGDRMGMRCLTALVNVGDTATISAAEDAGFRCYDVRTELDRPVQNEPVGQPEGGVRQASERDLASLEPIARTRFSISRFYADPNFPRDRVGELYVAWLRRGLADDDRFVCATSDLDGFVVCQLEGRARVGTIELIAVSPESEGSGLGAQLLFSAEEAFAAARMTQARVVTQGANLPAQRLYQRQGFRTRGVALWLHRWSLPSG